MKKILLLILFPIFISGLYFSCKTDDSSSSFDIDKYVGTWVFPCCNFLTLNKTAENKLSGSNYVNFSSSNNDFYGSEYFYENLFVADMSWAQFKVTRTSSNTTVWYHLIKIDGNKLIDNMDLSDYSSAYHNGDYGTVYTKQ